MVSRPTIRDLADAAGVSVSTVNRVINQPESVRLPTRNRVLHAAEDIGFYGLGSIETAIMKSRETHTIGVLLQQSDRAFYRGLGNALEQIAESYQNARIVLKLEYLSDLNPENVAARIRNLGNQCEAIAVVAAEHPRVSQAINDVQATDTPVIALIAPLSADGEVGYVGLDSWKVGRTAAWGFDKMCRDEGEIAILVGNPRYRNQELNEIGFRSYFREHASGFTLLEPRSTFESLAIAKELTTELIRDHPNLKGIFVSGGGITGVLEAVRQTSRAHELIVIGYELFEATRNGLIDGSMTMSICHPIFPMARQTIQSLIDAKVRGVVAGATTTHLNFEIYTSQNI